ncbi:alpha/beta hydrolase fold domain-containing protein [Blastococcus sp. SYSU DS0828]
MQHTARAPRRQGAITAACGLAAASTVALALATPAQAAPPAPEPTVISDLAYGPATPGNLLDLHLPGTPRRHALPLVVWHSGSAWFSNDVKTGEQALDVVEEFTGRGYAVATINVRSSADARFPEQGYDVRAAVRYLRENAAQYGLDPDRFAFMGNSSGGWSAAFAATTSDIEQLPGETGVDGTSSAVQVAVPFFPPTDFLSMDTFAADNDLPMQPGIYPHDAPTSPESLLIHCPGEEFPGQLSIQACPEETEAADPSSYIEGEEIPVWVLHGLADPLLPYNQSRLVYDTTTAEGNEARFTLVPDAGHSVDDIIGAEVSTTWMTNHAGRERVVNRAAPTWHDIDRFLRAGFAQAERANR